MPHHVGHRVTTEAVADGSQLNLQVSIGEET
jgi:hypothetical protein